MDYEEFENKSDILSSNIACTVLKVQEKKTQKGNSYGIVKFSDLSNVCRDDKFCSRNKK